MFFCYSKFLNIMFQGHQNMQWTWSTNGWSLGNTGITDICTWVHVQKSFNIQYVYSVYKWRGDSFSKNCNWNKGRGVGKIIAFETHTIMTCDNRNSRAVSCKSYSVKRRVTRDLVFSMNSVVVKKVRHVVAAAGEQIDNSKQDSTPSAW